MIDTKMAAGVTLPPVVLTLSDFIIVSAFVHFREKQYINIPFAVHFSLFPIFSFNR